MSTSDAISINRPWQELAWQEEYLFPSSKDFFNDLFDSIQQAQKSVLLHTYIFDFDPLGKRMIEALTAARLRGVDVKVLFDGFGSMEEGLAVADALEEKDIAVRIFHPLPWQPEHFKRALRRTTVFGSMLFNILKINRRHHAKICIIDDQSLYCGSQNISNCHASEKYGGQNWHDYGAKVSGGNVVAVKSLLEDFWCYRKPKIGEGLFRFYLLNVSSFARREKSKLLVEKLATAKRRIWIINPYFSPPTSIIRALKHAARRGVDVRIIVPKKSDIEFFPLLTSVYHEELLKVGVRVFEYLPRILHAKLLLADDFCLMGSTNLNHRSMLHDVEFDIVLDDQKSIRAASESLQHDQLESREITLQDVAKFRIRRWLGWIPWILRYWL